MGECWEGLEVETGGWCWYRMCSALLCEVRAQNKTKTGGAGKYKETCVEFFPPATVRRLWYEMSRTDVFYLQASLGGVPIIPQQFLLWLVTDRHRCLVPFYIKPTVKVAKHQNSLCKIAAGCMLDMTQHSEGLAITHGAELNCRHARNS